MITLKLHKKADVLQRPENFSKKYQTYDLAQLYLFSKARGYYEAHLYKSRQFLTNFKTSRNIFLQFQQNTKFISLAIFFQQISG